MHRLAIIDESPAPKPSRQQQAALVQGAAAAAAVPREVHLRVEVVSADFEGMSMIKRQRRVHAILEAEFGVGLHALSLETKAPSEVTEV